MNQKLCLGFLAISLGLTIAATVDAQEIYIRRGGITVNQQREREIYIDTGRIQINTNDTNDSRVRNDRSYYPYDRSNRQCTTTQNSRQVNQSGRTSSQTSSHHYCR